MIRIVNHKKIRCENFSSHLIFYILESHADFLIYKIHCTQIYCINLAHEQRRGL